MNENELLTYIEEVVIPFAEPWGWISMFRYRLHDSPKRIATSQSILRALFMQRAYRHAYLGTFTPTVDEGEIHGPYLLRTIRSNDYQQSSWNRFLEAIQHWTNHPDYSKPDTIAQARLHDLLAEIPHYATTVLSFVKREDMRQHELGWVLTEFEEFLLIDTQNKFVFDVVWGVD